MRRRRIEERLKRSTRGTWVLKSEKKDEEWEYILSRNKRKRKREGREKKENEDKENREAEQTEQEHQEDLEEEQ